MPKSSFQFTRDALESFLGQPSPGILAVKGKWGVGKTYLWQETVKNYRAPAGATVAYVSLFGVTSVAELRRMIVSRRAPFPKSATLKSKVLAPAVRATTLLRYIDVGVIKNTELLAEAVEDSVLRNIVVCVDDLERKEPALSDHALLGFLTSLRDEKNCKVVLLFNEEAAAKIEKLSATLTEYREKVIDAEIALQPTMAECFDLVFARSSALEVTVDTKVGAFLEADDRTIRGIFADARIANIRVLRRTREALSYFENKLRARYPLLWPHFARQTAKLCILHLVHGRGFSLREVVEKDRWVQFYLEQKEREKKGGDLGRFAPIFDLNFHPAATDSIIVDYLITGYVDFEAARDVLENAEKSNRRDVITSSSHKNWNLLWDNFQASGETFIVTQTVFLRDNFNSVSLADLSQFVEVAERIGECAEARKMLETKISQFVDATRDIDGFGFSLTGVTQSVVERIQKLRASTPPTKKPVGDIVNSMAGRDGWNPSDLRFVVGSTEEEFYQWIVTSTDPELITKLKIFRTRIGDGEIAESVRQKFESALRRIAARSATDEYRVRHGVGVDPKEEEKR